MGFGGFCLRCFPRCIIHLLIYDMLKIIASFILFVTLLITPRLAIAAYVLPYPSIMPGNKLYQVSRVVDQLKKYWYFGNIAQIKYHLGLADKYLVEAKTLLEYKQYLLGVDALKRSDVEFQQLPVFVAKAEKEQKDIKNFKTLIIEAATMHRSVLSTLESTLPAQFTWIPEKEKPTELNLKSIVHSSIEIRK